MKINKKTAWQTLSAVLHYICRKGESMRKNDLVQFTQGTKEERATWLEGKPWLKGKSGGKSKEWWMINRMQTVTNYA